MLWTLALACADPIDPGAAPPAERSYVDHDAARRCKLTTETDSGTYEVFWTLTPAALPLEAVWTTASGDTTWGRWRRTRVPDGRILHVRIEWGSGAVDGAPTSVEDHDYVDGWLASTGPDHTFEWDASGRLAYEYAFNAAIGTQERWLDWDDAGRILSYETEYSAWPGTDREVWSWDGDGRLLGYEVRDSEESIDFDWLEHDAATGLPTSGAGVRSDSAYSGRDVAETWSWDAQGRPLAWGYTLEHANPRASTWTYTDDGDGTTRVERDDDDDGDGTVDGRGFWRLDAAGRIVATLDADGNAMDTYTRDADGALRKVEKSGRRYTIAGNCPRGLWSWLEPLPYFTSPIPDTTSPSPIESYR